MTGLQALTDHLKQVIPFGISGRVRRIAGLAAGVADFPRRWGPAVGFGPVMRRLLLPR